MKNNTVKLKQNQSCYFANKKVVIIKIYETVHLIKVRFENTDICTTVDINALSDSPEFTNAISLKVIGG